MRQDTRTSAVTPRARQLPSCRYLGGQGRTVPDCVVLRNSDVIRIAVWRMRLKKAIPEQEGVRDASPYDRTGGGRESCHSTPDVSCIVLHPFPMVRHPTIDVKYIDINM